MVLDCNNQLTATMTTQMLSQFLITRWILLSRMVSKPPYIVNVAINTILYIELALNAYLFAAHLINAQQITSDKKNTCYVVQILEVYVYKIELV